MAEHESRDIEKKDDSGHRKQAQPIISQLKQYAQSDRGLPVQVVAGIPMQEQAFLISNSDIHSAQRAEAVFGLQQTHGNRYVQKLAERSNQPTSNEDIIRGIEIESGSGKPLEYEDRSEMEAFFKHDLSQVRIHSDNRTDQLCRELGARAFTQGSDIFIRSEEGSQPTDERKELLRHELAHVVQQKAGRTTELKGTGGNTTTRSKLEEEAEQASHNFNNEGTSNVSEVVMESSGTSEAIQLIPVSAGELANAVIGHGRDQLDILAGVQHQTAADFYSDLRSRTDRVIDEVAMMVGTEAQAGMGAGGALGGGAATVAGVATGWAIALAAIAALVGIANWRTAVETKAACGSMIGELQSAWDQTIDDHRREYESVLTSLAGQFAGSIPDGERDTDNYTSLFERFDEFAELPSRDDVSDALWNQLCDEWNTYVEGSEFRRYYSVEADELLMARRSREVELTPEMRVQPVSMPQPAMGGPGAAEALRE